MSFEVWVALAAVLAVGVLLVLIIALKVQEFLALLLTTILFGLAVGNTPTELMDLIVGEMGDSLGQLAIVIALGAIFGMILQRAGAAQRIALTLVERYSDRTIAWGLGLAGFLVATSVYIDVAIVILVPMLYGVAQRTGKSLLHYGIPLCAGLSAAYTFMPPAPGPLAASGIMGADIGLVVLFGVICGIPAVAVAGPLFGRFIGRRIHVVPPASVAGPDGTSTSPVNEKPAEELPSFGSVVVALLMPLMLILVGTAGRVLDNESTVVALLTFVGHPVMALLITVLYSMWVFGIRRGVSRAGLQELAGNALGPAGNIILVTGAGGVFGGVLVSSGLGDTLSNAMRDASIPLVVFGFVVAATMRISQGSGLVAMVTGATFSAPLAESLGASPATVALTCIAIACGGAGFSHVNDSGFWMANRYFGMSVADTLKSWTIMKSLVGIVGFTVVLALSPFVG
ncbi:gluconate transporter [Prauserella sp. ASG 168]|uniref:Gluconate transporter n=2 Tax=Prauserella cavernicola TaxID=2800127 RepID=A0A934V815_9PSEU|nr:gluconate transporter [Prauserella cavernicola]